jgi:O-antigen ligase
VRWLALGASQTTSRGRRPRQVGFSADDVIRALLASVIIGSVLAFGTQHASVTCLIALPCVVLAIISARRLGRPPALVWWLLALVAFTLLQVVPLPLSFLSVVAPHSSDVWSGLSALEGYGRARGTISLDPGASALEALRWAMYAAVLSGALVARRTRSSSWLAQLLFLSALALAVVTLLHGLLDAERIYGIHQPSFTVGRFRRGPLLNSNNLSGYLNLGLAAGAGLWLAGRSTLPRPLLALGMLIILSIDLASGSRGGLLVLILAALALAVWYARAASPTQALRTPALVAATVVLFGFAAAFLLVGDSLLSEWVSGDVKRKTAVWRWSIDLIRDNAWLGVGRGAFESAFGAYRGHLGHDWTSVFSHPENIVLQWATEWGVVVGVGSLIGCALLLIRAFMRGKRDALHVCLALGLVALVAQNLVDLSSEVPGVAMAMMVAAAAILDRPKESGTSASFRVTLLVGAGATGLVVLAFTLGRHQVRPEREVLGARYRSLQIDDPSARATFRAALTGAMSRHPAEAYFPLLGGLVAHRAGDQNALRWLDRALELGPGNGTTHLALANVLKARGADGQALLHLRLAVARDATLQGPVVARAAAWAKSLDELEYAFPEERRVEILADACLKQVDFEKALPCWRRVSERRPHDVLFREALVETLSRAIERKSPSCAGTERPACVDEVRSHTAHLVAQKTSSWRCLAALARVSLDDAERKRLATQVLDACSAVVARSDCSRELLTLADRLAMPQLASRAADMMIDASCTTTAGCAEAHDAAANIFIRHGAWGLGLQHRLEAARLVETGPAWLAVAQTAAQARNFTTATIALQRAEGLSENRPLELERLAAVRAEILGAAASGR